MNPDSETSQTPFDPDDDLLQEVRKAPEGDLRAFEQLVLRHQRRIVANCRYLTGDPNNAEDLTQDVLVKAFFGLPKFDRKSSFGHWLTQMKIDRCLHHLSEQGGRTFVRIDDLHDFRSSIEKTDRTISEKHPIGAVLDSMSDDHRIPLLLRDMDQLSYQEIALTLGLSLSATKMRIRRARQDFRERYGNIPTTLHHRVRWQIIVTI
jgi:RNA polymerase sigma-70 factor (ECF subfamily)